MDTFIQTAWYEYSYKHSQEIADDEIQTFVMCAKQPQQDNREQYGYTIRVQAGVYKSTNIAYEHITLISLNELPNQLHNAWVTCLASRKLKRRKSFELLKERGFKQIRKPFKGFLIELWRHISTKGDDDMTLDLSPKEIKEIGDMWGVNYYSHKELQEEFEKMLRGLKPEERLMGLKPEERLAGLNPSDVINYFKSEQLEEIEAIIKQLKQQR